MTHPFVSVVVGTLLYATGVKHLGTKLETLEQPDQSILHINTERYENGIR